MRVLILSGLLVVANIFGAGMIIPQVVRLYRNRVVEGISGTWVGLGISMNVWWLAYALSSGASGLIPVSLAAAVLYGIVAALYAGAPSRPNLHSLAVGLFGFGSLPLAVLVLGGWQAAGLAIGLAYGLQFAPAAVSAWRSNDTTGISPSTWVMAWIEAVIWFVYGIAIGDWALMIGGSGGAAMATLVLAGITTTGSERRAAQQNLSTDPQGGLEVASRLLERGRPKGLRRSHNQHSSE